MKKNNNQLPKVSFIIPTLNASKILPKCLTAIRSQSYPQKLVEIIIADGGSTDNTLKIAKKYHARIIKNKDVLHEPGKTKASLVAKGEILFYTDADNILSSQDWLLAMTKPYFSRIKVTGYLPITVPAPDSNPLDRYLGYLSTDPLTWFIYGLASSPCDYIHCYIPIKITRDYQLYRFTPLSHPLFGLSQGVGTHRSFHRTGMGAHDDILAGIKLIKENNIIAYVPSAHVYHYHVTGMRNFLNKYRWRVRNNIQHSVTAMGLSSRMEYFTRNRKMRIYAFIPYALSIILPFIDSISLMKKHRDPVMLLHTPASFLLALAIVYERFMLFYIK